MNCIGHFDNFSGAVFPGCYWGSYGYPLGYSVGCGYGSTYSPVGYGSVLGGSQVPAPPDLDAAPKPMGGFAQSHPKRDNGCPVDCPTHGFLVA
ncbi:PREDICTED: uncharacterized protein LOC106725148 [Myotis brandtii]|uniref:uncharacterized protein LOC106725148 n=1 Tax=Myotis brandtii TaxID=109478 RepID=UPI0007040CF6|nr:PREDICTED: uncharacterized protein LOC106725148 [Myotis brandtii]